VNKSKLTDQALLDIILLGPVDETAVSIVAANLQAVMGLNTDIQPVLEKPDYAYLPGRGQYDAAKILNAIAETADKTPFKLGLTEYDLCTPILTFVYGESQLGGKAAVISLQRLFDRDLQLTYLRAAKISLHEVGHLLGIGHCWQPDCLMHFSSNLEMLDSLNPEFCSACEYEVGRRLKTQFADSQAGLT
jgi:archaemetzincin